MTDDTNTENPMARLIGEEYHVPPPVPREEMWTRIRATLDAGRSTPVVPLTRARLRTRPGVVIAAWITGIAALLALGVGIGRFTVGDGSRAPTTAGPTGTGTPTMALSAATVEHLSRAASFLTTFRSDTEAEEETFDAQARALLTTTRLLLDTPAGRDPRLRSVLDDLEFILAQIIQIPADRPEDRDLITDGLETRQLMPRLRTAIPPGTSPRPFGAS